jgi:serine/threonine protein kinase
VILLDFNAARFYSGDPCRESDTQLLGTKGYAAPEQYGFGESSPQTDLFSVGKILQNCINSLPKDNITAVSIRNKLSASPAKNNDPHIFDNVIQKCTQLTPSKRYSSAEALKNALLSCLGESSRPDITGKVVNPYLPPGFRTLNLWKMIIASVVYIFIFCICFTLQVKGSSGLELLFEKVGIFALALMNIAMGSNYLGIQQYLLFNRSSSRALRIAGTLISMIASTVFLFMVMILFIGMFFAS